MPNKTNLSGVACKNLNRDFIGIELDEFNTMKNPNFKEIAALREQLTASLATQGIVATFTSYRGWRNDNYREYVCSACGKKDHREKDL